MAYLVPVQGGVAQLQKRNRTILETQAALATVAVPSIYIYNVGRRPWKGVGGGKEWIVPGCPKGERYSVPVEVPALVLSERDLADGGNNLDTVIDAGLSGMRKIGQEVKNVMGVADDIVGRNSTSPGLDLHTTNGQWFGVFVSQNVDEDGTPCPLEDELEDAESRLQQMMQLVYAQGSEKVQAGEKVAMADRRLYNDAAEQLHARPLWGNLDHTMDSCPLCGEDIRVGAKVCKHCHNNIDPASVEAFLRKQQEDAREEIAEAMGVPGDELKSEAPRPAKTAKKKGSAKNN